MRTVSSAQTDVGKRRELNEDAFFACDELQLYMVADGMGGHAAGEIASSEAIDSVHGTIRGDRATLDAYLSEPGDGTVARVRRLVESAIQHATYMVYAIAEQDPTHKGMGTTMTVLLVVGDVAVVGSVGDSRAYLVRNGRAWQVTEDHTLVQLQMKAGLITEDQAKASPRGNVITRAVGPREYVQVDTFVVPVQDLDRYLLCSDGLHGYLDKDELAVMLGDPELTRVCGGLIDVANDRGGKDNITCIVVECRDEVPPAGG